MRPAAFCFWLRGRMVTAPAAFDDVRRECDRAIDSLELMDHVDAEIESLLATPAAHEGAGPFVAEIERSAPLGLNLAPARAKERP